MHLDFKLQKNQKGGGLWINFSIKSCPLIGPNLNHVIKCWPLIGQEDKWFNWSSEGDGCHCNHETSKLQYFNIYRQIYKNQNLYMYVWGGSLYSVSLELLIFNNSHISTQIYKPTKLFVHVKGGGLLASLFYKSVI